MRSILVGCILLLVELSAWAATSKDVAYKSGGETVHGIQYVPQGKGPFPGIIVIHEWWGLNDWVKEQASRLADQGYVTLAIDLYRGKVATTANEAHEFMGGVPQDRAKRDLQAAFQYLESQPNVKPDRIGAIGWCMGGGYALQLALEEPKLAADVINYGVFDYAGLANDPASLNKIHAPILGIFGAQDRGISAQDVRNFGAQLDKLGKRADFTIFPDAGHAFENPNNKDGYRAQDAQEAWKKTVEFFARTLKNEYQAAQIFACAKPFDPLSAPIVEGREISSSECRLMS
jgi:carboxymethylenebutenolidase